jgi:DNA-binding SARP family transcriptional activator
MRLHVDVLGGFQVAVDGIAVPASAWRRASSALLVRLLALSTGHRLHREQAMDALWPDMLTDASSANLRKAVHFARRALGTSDAIVFDSDIVALAGDVTVDAEMFEASAKAAVRANNAEVCAQAADLYPGVLLPDDRYVAWTDEPRERLRQLHTRVLRIAGLWDRLLETDPTDEEAQRAVMQAALDAGNRGEVIRQFQRLRERLRTDMGVGPAKATVAIYEKALASDAARVPSALDRVRASLAWGIINLHSGEFAKAEAIAREARTLAFEARLAREVGEASALVGMVAHMQGKWPEIFRTEFIEWIRQGTPFTHCVFDGHLCLAEFCLCGAAGHDHIAGVSRELLAAAENAQSVAGRALATLILGEAALFAGRLDDAEQLLTEADALHENIGANAGRALTLQRLAEVSLARGQKYRANRLAQKALRIGEAHWLAPHLLIRLQAVVVEAAPGTAKALAAINDGDRWLSEGNPCQPCSMGFRLVSSIALAEAGELSQASRRIDEAERVAGMWNGGPWVAAVWEARGVLRLGEGNREQASALFREAATRYKQLGRSLDEQRCYARAGKG